ncbi:M28 family peptidase [Pseudonocardia acaciae]|uniref:M28 family peptidase n=1 Tax=Pseudonocardia acaciae TaxID=551276 RepID=UPI0005656BCC|nr:M28 family peptidase [Pseudonocardia acaciae]
MTVAVAALDEARMMAHVEEFARWTKHAGTEGERASLGYIERELRSYGFATQLIEHPAYISLPVRGGVRWDGGSVDGGTHSFSRSSGPDGVSAPLVAVGAGRADDYAGLDVRGKVVLVDGVPGPATTLEAGRRGALAQVHVCPHEHHHEMCLSPVWGSPDDQRLRELPDTVVVSVGAPDGQRLRDALAAAGDEPFVVTVDAEVQTGWRSTPILIADLVRADDEPFVLFSGHHDTWHHGVMDNGTGNATMLEVARACAERRGEWRRGLRLAFWSGHSQGRYSSSAWYADHHWEELERRALVHVNVDSTGGMGNTVVCDATSSAELAHLAEEALYAESGQHYSGRRMHRAGDQSFWGIGVPALFANMSEQPASEEPSAWSMVLGSGGPARAGAGTGWWWHTPYDTADKIDPELLARDTRIYLHAVWRLLTDPVLPLDYAASARALRDTLLELAGCAQGRFDLSLPLRRAEELLERAEAFASARVPNENEDDIARANATLVALSRVLVPLDYTACDRFDHDPALFLSPLHPLADVTALAAMEPGSDEFLFLESRLVRARNRVAFALRAACDVLA